MAVNTKCAKKHRNNIEKYNDYKIPTTLGRKEYTYLELDRGEEQRIKMKKIPVQEFEKCVCVT